MLDAVWKPVSCPSSIFFCRYGVFDAQESVASRVSSEFWRNIGGNVFLGRGRPPEAWGLSTAFGVRFTSFKRTAGIRG
jgi:hypothetical protein